MVCCSISIHYFSQHMYVLCNLYPIALRLGKCSSYFDPSNFYFKKKFSELSDVILSINVWTYLSVWIACLKALTSSGDLWSRLLVVDFYCVLIRFLSEIFVLKHKNVAFRNILRQSINMFPKNSFAVFLKRCCKYTVGKIHPLYVENHLVTLENEK